MQSYTAFEQGFEQIHYVSLRIWFKLIKIIKRFVKGTEYVKGTPIKGCKVR